MVLRYKPVLVAGFSFLFAAFVVGQDYIDVEAERAARQAAQQRPTQAPVQTQASVVISPQSTQATNIPDEGNTGYGAIKPYSGTTSLVTPVSEAPLQTQGATPGDLGSLVILVQQLQADVRRLNGLVEEQAQELRVLQEQSLQRYVDIDRRLSGVTQEGPGAMMGAATESSLSGDRAELTQSRQPQNLQANEQARYDEAYALVTQRQFDAAVTAFKAFLEQYPFGKLAPNAHYWLGELYLVLPEPDPELARQSFKLLLDQYPDNPKVPDAMYKLGRVYFLKGNKVRSKEYLDRVISTYGSDNHPAAQLAQDFLSKNF
jgi:tol-pal system protein YbgF